MTRQKLEDAPDGWGSITLFYREGGEVCATCAVPTRTDAAGREHLLRDLHPGDTWTDIDGYEVVPIGWTDRTEEQQP